MGELQNCHRWGRFRQEYLSTVHTYLVRQTETKEKEWVRTVTSTAGPVSTFITKQIYTWIQVPVDRQIGLSQLTVDILVGLSLLIEDRQIELRQLTVDRLTGLRL